MKKLLKVLLILVAVVGVGLAVLVVTLPDEAPAAPAEAVVVYEDANYKISYLGVEDEDILSGAGFLKLKVENNTERAVDVFVLEASVDGSMVNVVSGVINTVSAGCSSSRPYTLLYTEEGFSAADAASVSFKVQVWDSETSAVLLTTDQISVGG